MSDDITIPSPTYRVPTHRGGMDPGTRKLAMIAAGIGGVLVLLVGGWHMVDRHGHGVPVVQAESTPMRVKPANPGGLQVAGMNNDIFSGGSDTDVEKLAPPPETPDPQALKAPPPAPVAAAPAVAAATAPAAPLPAPAPALRDVASAPAPVAAAATAAAGRAVARPATAPAAPAAGGKGPSVQLAALSSEQAARDEWARLQKRWPELLGGRHPAISRIERDGHAFWRVRTDGFEGVSQAAVFCERVRAKGGGCSVAEF